MFASGLSPRTRANLELLAGVGFVKQYYLAGGTAAALRLGHRLSVDLDFFSQKPAAPLVIVNGLKKVGQLKIYQNEPGTFNGELNGVKLSFFVYPYRLLRKAEEYKGIRVASLQDIGCMKLDAVASRGTKRDFIDLFFITMKIKLADLLNDFSDKYRGANVSMLHILKSLAYFEDAEAEPSPKMLKPVDWGEVKQFFLGEVRRLARKELGIGAE